MEDIEKRIDSAFKRYSTTIDLLKEFVKERSNTQEFILLVCARLDSLSNMAFRKKSQKDNFVEFLVHHSGHKNKILSISLPDLYEYLDYQQWVLPGSLEKDGRLHMFYPQRDEKYVTFIWNSGIPINQTKVESLLKLLLRALKNNYRVVPNQSASKKSIDSLNNVVRCFENLAQRSNRIFLREAIVSNQHLSNMIRDFSLASMLYREYRCGIIHEYGVDVDPLDFYSKREVYFRTLYNDFVYPTRRLRVQFSASFLLDLLVNSINSYRKRLQQIKRLPIDMYSEICDFMEELKYLDEGSIREGRDVGINISTSNSS
jgi:hypothetical protein